MSHPTPYYIIYEDKLRRNLEIIADVMRRADVKIIMALKANAMWKTFHVIAEYVKDSTASSINEMRLSLDYLGGDVHAYCPVYTDDTFPQFMEGCTHITFNTLEQYNRFAPQLAASAHRGKRVSAGLRVNPRCSVIETDIYNPCVAGSRFGETPQTIGHSLPEGIEGLHFHALCESSSYDLEKVLDAFENQYGHLLTSVKWVNMGGGHLMTRKDYNRDHLVRLLRAFKERHPHLQVILEPGSAFTWQTGDLEVSVLDVVKRDGISTAIIDASFACHMPDTLEMPYKPVIAQADDDNDNAKYQYRLGGNSCLSGDYCGPWRFQAPLSVGQRLTLCDMNHYTNVKTTMFNGIQHPDILYCDHTGRTTVLRHYTYDDYRRRMD